MSHPVFKKKLLASCVAAACSASLSMVAHAQDGVDEEVVVFGIRGSLERSADIKREAIGVVDAISAEDMGKFPDTNLAESLQRISGVSIDRVNGEGSQVTVRGFRGENNLVTLNGRHMPSSNVAVIGGDQNADFTQGNSRSFDFSNLASEGVSGIEVYKTGRASIPSGGIGATINIKTHRPLDNPGFTASVGLKAVNDTGVVDGDDITPEFSGLVSYGSDVFGASLFASYQERDSSSRSATVNGWNIRTFDFFNDPANGLVRNDGSTNIVNAPADGTQLVSFPNDSRWHLSENERERTNAVLTLQFRPIEALTLTVDALMAENTQEETRNDSTNWFNRPFDSVVFDSNPEVASTIYLSEQLSGVKDMGFEQQLRSVEDTLDSVGFNADWQISDSLGISLDVHSSEAETKPNGSGGNSSILISMGAPVVAAHSVNFRSGFPVQVVTMDDSVSGNGNGVLDVGDLGTQIARTIASGMTNELDEVRIDLSWENDFGTFDFGYDQRDAEMRQQRTQTQQTLGNWGIGNPGEVPENLMEAYCLACLYEDFEPHASGATRVSFKGNAGELFDYFSPIYADAGNPVALNNFEDNLVEEEVSSFYVQLTKEGELGSFPYQLLAGLRYEQTDVTSTSYTVPTTDIVWQADNDFTRNIAPVEDGIYITETGEYTNTLPSVDLSLNVTDELKLRGSISKTISRPGYGSLFVAEVANAPNRPGALGGVPTGNSGNPSLKPLESRNIDVSIEFYYGDANYFSFGTYDKEIDNFLGTGTENRNLFGLRDPSSGESGISGQARDALIANGVEVSDVTLFTLSAMLANPNDPAAAVSTSPGDPVVAARWDATPLDDFLTEFGNTGTFQTFVNTVLAEYDLLATSADPLETFAVQIPVNNQTANIHGFEVAWQHFFGDSGFGVLANYTTVDGDVSIDVGADPSVNQFALLGLSDSYNLSAIYENDALSARVSYNWRDQFLNETNRGADRNPVFVDEYSQIDLNVSYNITEFLALSFEAINLTGESIRHFGRDESNLFFMQELDPRYLLGVRLDIE